MEIVIVMALLWFGLSCAVAADGRQGSRPVGQQQPRKETSKSGVRKPSDRRLTVDQVRMIRKDYASGRTQAEIAEGHRIPPSTVHDVVTRRTWRNV